MSLALLIISGLLLLPIIYDLLFPVPKPDLRNYFQPGETYTSKAEGVTQIVLRQEGDGSTTRSVLSLSLLARLNICTARSMRVEG
jgi:hypothetical protein